MIRFIMYICFFGAFSSCNYGNGNKSGLSKDIEPSSGIKVDTFTSGKLAVICQYLGVPELGNNIDSIQIRIWLPCDYGRTENLYLLHYRSGRWFSRFYYFTLLSDSAININEINSTLKIKEPKSGWKSFINKLGKTRIQVLPDHKQIRGYYRTFDPLSIYVEVSKKDFYRYYSYPNFEQNIQLKDGPANLKAALDLIKSEFNYDLKCE